MRLILFVLLTFAVLLANASGQAIYDQYCSTCHKTGLAGAPKFQAKEEWKPRLDAKQLEGLVASALQGLNAMPPKGTCQQCTEQEIKEAIQYMLQSS